MAEAKLLVVSGGATKNKKDFTTTKSCGRIEFSRTADYLLQMVLETKQTARKKTK